MSYWASDNVIRIGEEQVQIPSENGLSYECGQNGRRVQLFVPPSVKFLSGKDSYLQFDLKINQPADCKTRLQLDPAGAGFMMDLVETLLKKLMNTINLLHFVMIMMLMILYVKLVL